jgi:hypothetical protein
MAGNQAGCATTAGSIPVLASLACSTLHATRRGGHGRDFAVAAGSDQRCA